MVDVKAYYEYWMAQSVESIESEICHITGNNAAGVAVDYENAVYGRDVKDNTFKLAILHLALLTKTNEGIDTVAELAEIAEIMEIHEGTSDVEFAGDVYSGDNKLADEFLTNSVYGKRLFSTWERGGIDINTGEDVAASTFIRSGFIPYSKDLIVYPAPSGIMMRNRVFNYDETGLYLGVTEYYTPTENIIRVADLAPIGTAKVRVSGLRQDGTGIPTADVAKIAENVIIAKSSYSLAGVALNKADKQNLKEKFFAQGVINNDGYAVFSAGDYEVEIDNPCLTAGLLTLTCKTTGTTACSIRSRLPSDDNHNLYLTSPQQLKSESVTKYESRVLGRYLDHNKLVFNLSVPTGSTLILYDIDLSTSPYVDKTVSGVVFSAVHGEISVCNSDTLPAFQAAANLGYPYAIATPKRTSDGVWICYHDDRIDVDNTFIRQNDGSKLPAEYHNKTFDQVPYENVVETWDFGVSRRPFWAGTRALKLDDYFIFCLTNGIMPSISMHPSSTFTVANLTEIKTMTDKLGVTKSLTLKFDADGSGMGNAMSVFGDSVARYVINVAFGAASLDTNISAFLDLATQYSVANDKLIVEVFAANATAENAAKIRNNGLIASVAQSAYVHSNGYESSFMYSEDIKKWLAMGYSEFTMNRTPLYGINF